MSIRGDNPFVVPFHATGLFLCPPKTLVNLWFSDIFIGSTKRSVARNELAELFRPK